MRSLVEHWSGYYDVNSDDESDDEEEADPDEDEAEPDDTPATPTSRHFITGNSDDESEDEEVSTLSEDEADAKAVAAAKLKAEPEGEPLAEAPETPTKVNLEPGKNLIVPWYALVARATQRTHWKGWCSETLLYGSGAFLLRHY